MQTSFLSSLSRQRRAFTLAAVFAALLPLSPLADHSAAQVASSTASPPTIGFHKPSGHISVLGTTGRDTVTAHIYEYTMYVRVMSSAGNAFFDAPLGDVKTLKVTTMEANDIVNLGEGIASNFKVINIPAEVFAGPGDDVVFGGTKNDTLNGGMGDDWIDGNDGYDTLNGDGGDDVLIGGLKADTPNGGPGEDICADAKLSGCETMITTQ